MKEAGNMLDLPVLDHPILSSKSYFRFANEESFRDSIKKIIFRKNLSRLSLLFDEG
jgi:hypothetical protein